jgi:hypothetical protein
MKRNLRTETREARYLTLSGLLVNGLSLSGLLLGSMSGAGSAVYAG